MPQAMRATSETRIITLPERPFSNPLARAVAEQRRILALDATQRDHVLDMLSAIMLRPEETIRNAAHYLGLATIRTRLRIAASDNALRDTADYMWQVALGIENGNLSAAERRLRQAQEALRNALQNGASQEEIEKLTADLRKAMQDFLREFAQRQQQNPNARRQAPDPNARMLTEKDLQRMMDQIENLARQELPRSGHATSVAIAEPDEQPANGARPSEDKATGRQGSRSTGPDAGTD